MNLQYLEEKLIVLGKKPYPKFGHVVFLAGGAGSGKGFVKENLLGIEGLVSDVDELKKLIQKTPSLIKKVKEEMGIDITKDKFSLKNPENVAQLHDIVSNFLQLDKGKRDAIFAAAFSAHPDRKPNLIFDVTLKDLDKFSKYSREVELMGYDKKNIHIVWIINEIDIALKQNQERDRTVPAEILLNTHRGVSQTMADIVNMGQDLKKYMDGDIVFAFNKIKVDSEVEISDYGGSYITKANYFHIKHSGKSIDALGMIKKEIRQKVAAYVPKNIEWI